MAISKDDAGVLSTDDIWDANKIEHFLDQWLDNSWVPNVTKSLAYDLFNLKSDAAVVRFISPKVAREVAQRFKKNKWTVELQGNKIIFS